MARVAPRELDSRTTGASSGPSTVCSTSTALMARLRTRSAPRSPALPAMLARPSLSRRSWASSLFGDHVGGERGVHLGSGLPDVGGGVGHQGGAVDVVPLEHDLG